MRSADSATFSDRQRHWLGLYLMFALRYRVAELCDGRPSDQAIVQLADRYRARFARLIRDPDLLKTVLLDSWRIGRSQPELTGGVFIYTAGAALGSLVSDPAEFMQSRQTAIGRWITEM